MFNREASFPFYQQRQINDCGPTCLKMIAKYYGKILSIEYITEKCFNTRQGMSMLEIADAGEALGLRSTIAIVNFNSLVEDVPLPAVVHWKSTHFVIVYRISSGKSLYIADPAFGLYKLTKDEFLKSWTRTSTSEEEPIIFFSPTPDFYSQEESKSESKWELFGRLKHYLRPHYKYIIQVFLSLLGGSLLMVSLPFLTQSIVDVGIVNQNVSFILLVLIAQLALFTGRILGDFIRSWILLHVGLRINITMASDFLMKVTRLPISYFESRRAGDFFQRMVDHDKIETFLTKTVTNTLFAILNLAVFLIVLLWFSWKIFLVFISGILLYVLWVTIFLGRRKLLDYKKFASSAENHDQLISLIHGMQEIKMNNAEKDYRWQWEIIQAKLFKISKQRLSNDQNQLLGSSYINEIKNIFIAFLSATSVISGELTLGQMLAIQYIVGQLNGPVMELVDFIRSSQDAMISLERITDVYRLEDEEADPYQKIYALPENYQFQITNLNFQYGGPRSDLVLKDINTTISKGEVTAIIGPSGSGKTTLMKLLLKFYVPSKGRILLGNKSLEDYSYKFWREKCAVVMQDGYIFAGTIAKNIVIQGKAIDKERLAHACKIANIYDFIDSLPRGYNTLVGSDGIGLSGGQKQRILIARAIYKDPEFIFFDEATSSLDTENERQIMENLNKYFLGKTVFIIAHRLSTVKNANKIIVLNEGEIVEEGTHNKLLGDRGFYYSLIKNQLELDI